MYLVDANILIYATDASSKHHLTARSWLDEHLAGPPRTVGLPWMSLLAFLRITTNPRIYAPPATVNDAWERVTTWQGRPAS